MHSALPQVNSDIKDRGGSRWRGNIKKVKVGKGVGTVVGVIISIYMLFNLVDGISNWWGPKVYHKGGIWNGAETLEISTSKYIYPDFGKISEYRRSQYVTTKDGRTVNSVKHSTVYSNGNDNPEVVLVVGVDDSFPQEYLEAVVEDRKAYAQKHGYGLYVRYLKDFATLSDGGASYNFDFSKALLMREAAFAFKNAKWLWWLDQDAIIMNHDYDISQELLEPNTLNGKMLRDTPLIPPNGVIHTYKRVPAEQIKFIIAQNDRGVSASSFILRNDKIYGNIFLNYWCDPLHRSYPGFVAQGPFGRLEASLTHMVQWHPAILSRMAVVPHKYLGSREQDGDVLKGQSFQKDHFVLLVRHTNEGQAPTPSDIAAKWNKAKKDRDGGE